MDLYKKMKTFLPKTQTVNKDRFYFVEDNTFIKIDTIIERGRNESKILKILNGFELVPKIIESYEEGSLHTLKMEFISGETLENCISLLTKDDKIKIIKDLTRIISHLFDRNIVHGDINESNIIFNLETKKTYLIDFETSKLENEIFDLGNYRGLQYIINFINL